MFTKNSFVTVIAPGQSFNGTLPGFGSGTLVAVDTAEIINQVVVSGVTEYTVIESSLQDIISNVTADGTLDITFPDDSGVEGYLVYASYAFQNLVRSGLAGPDPQNFIQNGSFAVDHFSATGAQVTTDFLEQFVLVNGAKELIEDVGNYSKYLKSNSCRISLIATSMGRFYRGPRSRNLLDAKSNCCFRSTTQLFNSSISTPSCSTK